MEIGIGFTVSALIAGLLTFLAPCTLPLIPAYLGFISGVNTRGLSDPETARRARRKMVANGALFILGFSLVFVAFGVLAGAVGQFLAEHRVWLSRIGGIFVILFGVVMLTNFTLPVFKKSGLPVPSWLSVGKPTSSFLVGTAFAFGWTPCVGPVLGSILLLASSQGTVFTGGMLLFIFSLGLAIPFLLIAVAFSSATAYIQRITRFLPIISYIGGAFLIALGVLLLTNNFGLLIQYGFELFDVFNYEGLRSYL